MLNLRVQEIPRKSPGNPQVPRLTTGVQYTRDQSHRGEEGLICTGNLQPTGMLGALISRFCRMSYYTIALAKKSELALWQHHTDHWQRDRRPHRRPLQESTASGVRPIEELLRERLRLDERLQQEFRREITLLFSDIQDSTAYFERHGDLDGRQMLQRHNDVLFPLISNHLGTVLKTVRDTIMASFAEPLRQCRQPSPCSAPCATTTVGGRWHSRFVCVSASTRARHWSVTGRLWRRGERGGARRGLRPARTDPHFQHHLRTAASLDSPSSAGRR